MFKPLRKKRVVNITMWSLVVVFVSWGIGSVATSGKNYAGVIFGKKITVQDYNRSYNSVLTRAKITYGDELSKMEKFLNLQSQAWDRLILKYEARKRSMRSSNREVIERIAAFGLFQRNGAFDKRLYDYIVGTVFGITPREFEESVRDDIVIDKLANSITKDISLTEDEIRQAYLDETQQGDISFLLIKPENYKDRVSVTDNEILTFYQERMDSFRSPVEVNVSYIRIPFADKDKKEDARSDAEELMADIKSGKSLGQVANEYKLELKETGFFSINSNIPEIGLSYPFILAALNLKQNQISDIVEINDSFCIMQLKDKKDAEILSFEDAKEKAKEMLLLEKEKALAKDEAEKLLSRMRDKNLTLEEAALELNSNISTSKQISRKSYIEEIGLSDSFIKEAFSLKVGEVGGPVKTENGYCLVRLDYLKPVDEEAFEKDKDAIAKKVMQGKRGDYFQKWFTDLKRKAAPEINTK